MPRVMIKGGVWKNTEDEILKAAVMKYGLNQWNRIASLLVRKSPKQCKARWYEWLDPSIKKTEWSRDEDEKLLHLAKLMPNQWKTISPIVGRTAMQCLERYEKLLDQAVKKDTEEEMAMDDPRKLRVGESDPAPEARPARPDAIDMDDEDKEMLSEARARLANTKGKKAKRKAREKQLEESRRIAVLQKRKELKEAGVSLQKGFGGFGRRGNRSSIFDYKTDIPFQRAPEAGSFDTTMEDRARDKDINKMIKDHDERRAAEREAKLKHADVQKHRQQARENLPAHLEKVEKLTHVDTLRKRSKLDLPAPAVSDQELYEIAKLDESGVVPTTGDSTSKLLTSYSQTPMVGGPGATPMRTPMHDRIMKEAASLRELAEGGTPLMPTFNNEPIATPNPYSRKRAGAGADATPSRTPVRDEMRINVGSVTTDEMGGQWGATPLIGAGGQVGGRVNGIDPRELTKSLLQSLTTLPKPSNDVEIALPESGPTSQKSESVSGLAAILNVNIPSADDVVDANDRIRAAKLAQQKDEQERLSRASTVLRRGLPRPAVYPSKIKLDNAERCMMLEEYRRIIAYDISMIDSDNTGTGIDTDEFNNLVHAYETENRELSRQCGANSRRRKAPSYLEVAKRLIHEESLKDSDRVHQLHVKASDPSLNCANISDLARAYQRSQSFSRGELLLETLSPNAPQVNDLEPVDVYRKVFESVKQSIQKDAIPANKTEKTLKVKLGGYMNKQDELKRLIDELTENIRLKEADLKAFESMEQQEGVAIVQRQREWKRLLEESTSDERGLQQQFASLCRYRDSLIATAASAK